MSRCLILIANHGLGSAETKNSDFSPPYPWNFSETNYHSVEILHKGVDSIEQGIYWKSVFSFYDGIKDKLNGRYDKTVIIIQRAVLCFRDTSYIYEAIMKQVRTPDITEVDIYATGKSLGAVHLMNVFEYVEKSIEFEGLDTTVRVPYAIIVDGDNFINSGRSLMSEYGRSLTIVPDIVENLDVFMEKSEKREKWKWLFGRVFSRCESERSEYDSIRHFRFNTKKLFPDAVAFPEGDDPGAIDRFKNKHVNHWRIDEYMTLFGWKNRSEVNECDGATVASLLIDFFNTNHVTHLEDSIPEADLA